MSAECEKCGTDLDAGLTCPVCEKAVQIEADTELLEACREALLASPHSVVYKIILARLNERLEEK